MSNFERDVANTMLDAADSRTAHEKTRIRQLEDAAAPWEHKYANARQYNRNLEERIAALEARCRDLEERFVEAKGDSNRYMDVSYKRAQRIAELEAAIRWACGEIGEFPGVDPSKGRYYWRTELRQRANLPYSAPETIVNPTHQHQEHCPKLRGGGCICNPTPLLHETLKYPCGCSASGTYPLPTYCGAHGAKETSAKQGKERDGVFDGYEETGADGG